MLAIDPNALIVSSSGVNKYPVDAQSLRNVILVAGYDYDRHGINHKGLCTNRFTRYMNKGASFKENPNWRFTLFDVGSGEVSVNEFDPVKRKRAWIVVKSFVPVTDSNYTTIFDSKGKPHYHFDKNQAGVMSITDIYEHIREVGQNHAGSLWELSFFSHGWMGGPILVNSSDMSGSVTDRDPNDKDTRLAKDFIFPAMDSLAFADFRSAFHADAVVWLWGCNFTKAFHEVIDKVVHDGAYKTKDTADADIFHFHFSDQKTQAKAYFRFDTTFFPPADPLTGLYQLTFTRTFAEVKDYFKRGSKRTFAQAIATASGRTCYGALLGTYADYERGVASGLMLIPTKKPPYKDNFTSYLSFYTTYLDVKIDPEGRGYAKHAP